MKFRCLTRGLDFAQLEAMGRAWLLVFAMCTACGGANDATTSACHGLSLGDCRLADGCVPDVCDGCGCNLNYRGCLATTETPAMCPALGCPSGFCCSSETTCSSGTCAAPGTPQGCGVCNTTPSNCTIDADCGAAMVCDPIACSCDGHLACTPGCTDDAACGSGATCDIATARCKAIACTGDADCPSNFGCAAHACARLSCTDDLACDGYCVDGACYDQRGDCRLPVP